MKTIAKLALAAVILLAVSACGTLQTGGAYNGDKTLYTADLTITTSYAVIDSFLTFEYQNRALLAAHPEVKKEADYIRANAKAWYASAEALRDAYQANPTTAGGSQLTSAIAILQTAVTQATTYLLQYQTPTPSAPAP